MYEDLMKSIHDAQKEVYAAQCKKNEAEYELRKQLAEQYGLSPFGVSLGGWECPDSPTKYCIYNSVEDPCHDDCIICHDPEERK